MNNSVLFVLPFISAIIGWIGNKLAIRYAIRNILRRKAALAHSLGQYVSRDLLQVDKLTGPLSDPAAFEALKPMIAGHVDNFLQVRLKEKIPVLAMFVSDAMLEKIKEGLLEEIDALLPQIINQYLSPLADKLDIGRMVEEKVAAIPAELVAQKIKSGLVKQRLSVELFGALLGFVIGLIQVAITVICK